MFFKTFINKNNNVDVNQVTQDLIEQTEDRIKIEKDNKKLEDYIDKYKQFNNINKVVSNFVAFY